MFGVVIDGIGSGHVPVMVPKTQENRHQRRLWTSNRCRKQLISSSASTRDDAHIDPSFLKADSFSEEPPRTDGFALRPY